MKKTDWGPIYTYQLWSRYLGRAWNLATKFVKKWHFFELKKKWNITYFKAKSICDKGWKIQNLRWQFSCIFRRRCRGILRFFVITVFMEKFADQNCIFSNFSKKKSKKGIFEQQNTPLRNFCSHFFLTHLLGLSKGFVLDPQILIGNSKKLLKFKIVTIIVLTYLRTQKT